MSPCAIQSDVGAALVEILSLGAQEAAIKAVIAARRASPPPARPVRLRIARGFFR